MVDLLAEKLKKKALISFIPTGYPNLNATTTLCDALVAGGTDILELGIPFSDPIADGPVIEAASLKAIEGGANVGACFSVMREVKKKHPSVPIVILTYYNIIYHHGIEKFAKEAAAAGVDAVLAADLTIEEAGEFEASCKKHGIKTVFIVALNTPDERVKEIAKHTTGFIYFMAHFGVTGTKEKVEDRTVSEIRRVKKLLPNTPLAVGFGISSGEHARIVASAGAQGVIVGSAYVKLIGNGLADSCAKISSLSKELKKGVEKA